MNKSDSGCYLLTDDIWCETWKEIYTHTQTHSVSLSLSLSELKCMANKRQQTWLSQLRVSCHQSSLHSYRGYCFFKDDNGNPVWFNNRGWGGGEFNSDFNIIMKALHHLSQQTYATSLRRLDHHNQCTLFWPQTYQLINKSIHITLLPPKKVWSLNKHNSLTSQN